MWKPGVGVQQLLHIKPFLCSSVQLGETYLQGDEAPLCFPTVSAVGTGMFGGWMGSLTPPVPYSLTPTGPEPQ